MGEFKALKHILNTTSVVDAPSEVIFPLLCPVREYDWIPTWACQMVQTQSGVNELDCVFETDTPGFGAEVWMTVRHDPCERLDFVRSSKGKILHFTIGLKEKDRRTEIAWRLVMVGLDALGNQQIAGFTQRAYDEVFAGLENLLNDYLHRDGGING